MRTDTGTGLGVDVVDRSRFDEILRRRGPAFLRRIFTPGELACSAGLDPAGRFAAKEAVMKSLGTGLSEGISWHDIEVTGDAENGLQVVLGGPALRLAAGCSVSVSLCGCGGDVLALAVLHRGE
jgi:holo-[acyl-carrier protein] synthase